MPLLGPNSTFLRVPGNATLYGKVVRRNGRLSRKVIQPYERIPKGFEVASVSVPKEDKGEENEKVDIAKKDSTSKNGDKKALPAAPPAVPPCNDSATTPKKRKRTSTTTVSKESSKATPKPKPSSTKPSSKKKSPTKATKAPLREVSTNSENIRPRTQTTIDSWLVKQPAA